MLLFQFTHKSITRAIIKKVEQNNARNFCSEMTGSYSEFIPGFNEVFKISDSILRL